jgi:hypothetical protein
MAGFSSWDELFDGRQFDREIIVLCVSAHSADPDQPFRPIVITDSGDPVLRIGGRLRSR